MPHKALVLGPVGLLGVAATLLASPALGDGFDKTSDDAIAAQKNAQQEKEKGDKMPGEKEKPKPKEDDGERWNPYEEPDKRYLFVGLRFRDAIVPKFLLNAFADGGRTVNVFMFGPEFTMRKNRFEYDFAFMYADYSMDSFLFKGHGQGDDAYELVSSTMKALYFTFDLLYDIPIDKSGQYSVLVGGGVGFGVVFGTLYRAQAFPIADPIDPNDPRKWKACSGPNPSDKWCDASNNHYQKGDSLYVEPSWANGGSKPNIVPYLSLPQVSFRYKPIKQLQTRFDLGFSITGFFFGLSASYGL